MPPPPLVMPPPEVPTAPPRLPWRVPLRHIHRRRPLPGTSPRALGFSLGVHAVLVLLAALFYRVGALTGPEGGEAGGAELSWVEIGPFPGATAPSGLPDAGLSVGSAPVLPDASGAPGSLPIASVPRAAGTSSSTAPSTGLSRRLPAGTGGAAPSARPGARRGGAGTAGRGATGGALRPGWRDPRLIPAPREIPPERELTEHERYMVQLGARLGVFNDSVAEDAERARRATDWTRTDKDGKKWGVSPGKIHLGGVTLPAPVGFSPPPAQRDELERRAKQRSEIDRQVSDAERDRAWEEQKRSARERRDRERGARDP